jgi:hypothetical protein
MLSTIRHRSPKQMFSHRLSPTIYRASFRLSRKLQPIFGEKQPGLFVQSVFGLVGQLSTLLSFLSEPLRVGFGPWRHRQFLSRRLGWRLSMCKQHRQAERELRSIVPKKSPLGHPGGRYPLTALPRTVLR